MLDIRGTSESRFLVGTSELLDVLLQAVRKWQNTKYTTMIPKKEYPKILKKAPKIRNAMHTMTIHMHEYHTDVQIRYT